MIRLECCGVVQVVIVHCSFLDIHRTAGVVPNKIVTIQMIIFTEERAAIASNTNFYEQCFLPILLQLENVCSDAALMNVISMDIFMTAGTISARVLQ